ncbi:MAG: hypothetical protein ACTHNQ_10940 [Microbacterium sp.]|uniref:hypothetical protein n=1 Tax=Microbacterium sp. TaxID=51671 RepID=UPI0003771584
MSFYTAQVIADERAATVARENALILAQRERRVAEIPRTRGRFSLARLFRATPARRSIPSATVPCPSTPATAPSAC